LDGRRAPPGGRLCVIEAVIPAAHEPFFHKFMDLNMLVMTGGRERTDADYRALFDAGGFRLNRTAASAKHSQVSDFAAFHSLQQQKRQKFTPEISIRV